MEASPQPYESVHALILTWQNGPESYEEQANRLATELKEWNFKVRQYQIEDSDSAHGRLNTRLDKFLDNAGPRRLLIIYYGGHGRMDKDKSLVWSCNDPKDNVFPNPEVNWTSLQQLFLRGHQSHVLFILDCCYAGAAVPSDSATTVAHAIHASGLDVTPGTEKYSLTNHFTQELKQRRKETLPISLFSLCNLLNNRMKWTGGKCVIPYHREFSLIPTPINFNLMSLEKPTAWDPVQQTPIFPLATSFVTSPISQTSADLEALPANKTIFDSSPTDPEHPRNEIFLPATPMSSATLPSLISRGQWHTDYQVQEFRQNPPLDNLSPPSLSNVNISGDFYHYDDLDEDEYRVLLLHSALHDDEPLAGQLCRQKLTKKEPPKKFYDYYVSSFWRSNYTSESFISIDHQRRPKASSDKQYTSWPGGRYAFRIPKSLEAALRTLRSESKPIELFIDYICIDKRDVSEKQMCYAQLPRVVLDSWKKELYNLSIDERFIDEQNFPSRWRQLATLLSNTKLGRRWIYEELSSARWDYQIKLWWGPTEISWVDLRQAVETAAIIYDNPRFRKQTRQLINIRSMPGYDLIRSVSSYFEGACGNPYDREKYLPSLEILVSRLARVPTTFPQDVIYVFRSVARDRAEIPLNYEHDPRNLFIHFVSHCVQTSQSIDILCRHWAPPLKVDGKKASLPSWMSSIENAPFGARYDLITRLNGDSLVGLLGCPDQKVYDASKGSVGAAMFSILDIDTDFAIFMTVSGFVLGTIERLTPSSSEGHVPAEALDMLGRKKSTDLTVPDYLWRSLVADRDPYSHSFRYTLTEGYGSACLYWLRHDETRGLMPLEYFSGRHPAWALEYLERVTAVVWNRCAVEVRALHGPLLVGLVPSKARVGDVVCILNGCSVPVVLRQTEKKELPPEHQAKAWDVIGESFIYGMMNREAMHLKHEYNVESREFQLV